MARIIQGKVALTSMKREKRPVPGRARMIAEVKWTGFSGLAGEKSKKLPE
jgi:hypothetical protein